MATDLLAAIQERYAASGGVEGLGPLWAGAAPDNAVQPYAVLKVASSRREVYYTDRDCYTTVVELDTYAGNAANACSLGDALGAIFLAPSFRLSWDGGAAARIRSEGDPTVRRDFRRAKMGQELWYQARRLLVHTIEDRTP